jgi:hypothetical protein
MMKNSKMNLTINKDDMEINDYLYCWSEMGERPNKTIFHSFFDPEEFLLFLEKYTPKKMSDFSDIMPNGDIPIVNQRSLFKVEDGFYVAFTIFDKLSDEKMIGDVSLIYNESNSQKLDEWIDGLNNIVESEGEEDGEVMNVRTTTISLSQNGFELNHLNLPIIELEQIDNFFSEETINRTERLIKQIRKGESGLTVLWNERGYGKTTLANYIISEVENTVIYVPLNMIELTISSPDFSKFLKQRKNVILVIDDAEIHFSEMFSKSSFYTGNLLQLVDGFGSKDSNLNIILILNNKNLNEIDPNLLKCNNILDVIKVEQSIEQKSKDLVTSTHNSNKSLNGKRNNLYSKNRFSKNVNGFGYK